MTNIKVKTVFSVIDKATAPIKKITKTISKFSDKIKSSFNKATTSTNKFLKKLKDLKVPKSVVKSFEKLGQISKKSINGANKSIKNCKKQLKSLKVPKSAINSFGKLGKSAKKALKSAGTSINKFKNSSLKSLNTVGEALNNVSGSAKDAMEKAGTSVVGFGGKAKGALLKVGGFLKSVGTAILPILKDQFKDLMKVGKDFNTAMAGISADFGGLDTTQLSDVENKIRELSRSTGLSTEEISNGFRGLGDAGMDFNQSMANMSSITDLSAASGLDLAKSTDLAMNAMKKLDIKAEKLPDLLNLMAAECAKSNISMEALASQIEDGSMSLTRLEQNAGNSSGALAGLADVARNNLGTKMAQLNAKFADMKLNVFKTMEPLFMKIADAVNKIVDGIGRWVEANKDKLAGAIDFITSLLDAFLNELDSIWAFLNSDAGKILLGIAAALSAVAVAMGIFNAVMSASPLTWFVLAILAVLAVGYLLWKNWDAICSTVAGAFTWLKEKIKQVWDWFIQILPTILTIFMPIIGIPLLIIQHWDVIKEFFINLFASIIEHLSGFINMVVTGFTNLIEGVKTAWTWITELPDRFLGLVSTIGEYVLGLKDNFVAGFWAIVDGVKGAWTWFTELPGKILGLVDSFFPFINLTEIIQGCWDALGEFINEKIEWIMGLAQGIGDFFSGIGNFFSGDSKHEVVNKTENDKKAFDKTGNSSIIESNNNTTNRTVVDLNLNGAPSGTSAVVRGNSEGFTLNNGQQEYIQGVRQ